MAPPFRVAVLGAGIIGMSSALRIIEAKLPGTKVSVIADKFSPDTTGDGAAGFWNPYLLGDVDERTMMRWCNDTFQFLLDLVRCPEAGIYGVGLLSTYVLRDEDPDYSSIFLNWREMTEKELAMFPKRFKYGRSFTTVFAECTRLIPYLTDRFLSKGGKLIRKKIHSISEFVGDYDVVVNCTGVWAAHLVPDPEVFPIRGQVIRVKAPWIKHAVASEDFHVLPNSDMIVCGGTHQVGNWNTDLDPEDRDRIWKGCLELVPSLKHATIVKEWVGLRPGRKRPRIERETRVDEKTKRKQEIIHNYGHGGSGVTLFWGCAKDVVDLLEETYKDFLLTTAERSRL